MPVRLFTIVPSMQSVSKLGQHVIIRSHVTFVRTFDGCISVGKNMMQDLNEFSNSSNSSNDRSIDQSCSQVKFNPLCLHWSCSPSTVQRLSLLPAAAGLLPAAFTVGGNHLKYRQNWSN